MENKFNGAFGAFLQSFEGLLGEFVNCAKPGSLSQRDGKEMMGESSLGAQVDPKSYQERLIEEDQLPARLISSLAIHLTLISAGG